MSNEKSIQTNSTFLSPDFIKVNRYRYFTQSTNTNRAVKNYEEPQDS